MASRFRLSRSDAYDETTRSMLKQVYRDIWTVLNAHDPVREWEADEEVRASVTRSLMTLVDAGVSDPNELRNKTLGSLPFWSRPKLSS